VKIFILTGIQRVKSWLLYKINSVSFMFGWLIYDIAEH